jgi:phosphoribosylaminoimidazolecarboxamide formyltransferase / IMP cyclohydrolase
MAHILNAVGGVVADLIPVKRALISVSDKTRLIELATALSSAGVALLSTGGTAKAIKSAGLEVIDVSDYTGSPEILDGRVKTLHPKVHGGLLGVRGNEKHEAEMTENGIDKIDLVIMNLYPFEATVARYVVHLRWLKESSFKFTPLYILYINLLPSFTFYHTQWS